MSDKPRLPFVLLDGALAGVQSAARTVTGLARAPFGRSGEDERTDTQVAEQPSNGAAPAADEQQGAKASADPATNEAADNTPKPVADTATSPAALAAAIDEKGSSDLAAHAGTKATSVVDSIPRADASHSGDDQPAPDEELGPEPFTPQVGP